MTKRAKKPTAAERALAADWEKLLKRHARPLERGAAAKSLQPPPVERRGWELPSCDTPQAIPAAHYAAMCGATPAIRAKRYTGDAMLGVATMHKSNSVPVFSTQAACDVSAMRRG